MRSRPAFAAVLAALMIAVAAEAQSQAPLAKRPIGYDAYDSWKSIQGTTLSRDGAWLAYALVAQEGDGALVVRNLRTGAEHRHPRGKDPKFTADGRFVAFVIAPLQAEVEKAKKAGKKDDKLPKSGFGALDVRTGQVFTADRVKSFRVPDEGSTVVAFLHEPSDTQKKERDEESGDAGKRRKERKKDEGTDLVVRDLASGASTTVPDVTEYAWNNSGSMLAYTVSSKTGASDGAFVRHTADGRVTTLLAGKAFYKQIAFDDRGTQAAFLSDRDEHEKNPSTSRFALYHWPGGARSATLIASATSSGMPEGWAPGEHGKIAFAKDGSTVFVGTAPAPAPAEDADAPEPVKVDLWHYKDPFLQPMQKVLAKEEEQRTYLGAVHLKDRRFVPLGSLDVPEVTLAEGLETFIGSSDVPYRQLVSWDGEYQDYFVVNVRNGTRQRLLEKVRFSATLSPGGGYIAYFDDREQAWFVVRTSDGKKTNLTGSLGAKFAEEDWDTPDAPRPYGAAGWLTGDSAIVLYDRFDIWEIKPDGSSPRMLTQGVGRAQKIAFRYQRTDPEEKTIDPGKPMLLAATDEQTRATGLYRVTRGAAPQRIVMLDKAFANLQKAKDADVYVFTLSRFEEFPDLWHSGPTFGDMKKVSDANPQQARFTWGGAELIDYVNADGKSLRATLIKPDNFDPARKYPLMVYIYETLSSNVHRYVPPAPGHSINVSRYVSNGYIVLQPDIVYKTGYPGESAFNCVIPAVQTVLAKGFIDPARIGIQGHSWGGYQITYLITRTNMFRAVEAGASVANMVSAYGGIRWGTGRSRAFQYERTQSRIGAPPWERPLEYLENSPIFWIEKVQTPYLTIHNDDDDAVPWYQGIEFFSAMRRLGKEAYMFVYNGEKHGLRQRENQKHFTIHLDEFFDHYLKGAPKPAWMEKGVPYLQRGSRDVTGYYRPKETDR